METNSDFLNKSGYKVYMYSTLPREVIIQDEKLDFEAFCEDSLNKESLFEYIHSIIERYNLKPEYWIHVYDNEVLIARSLIFIRDILSDGDNLKLGGFGGLATKREYRRKGIASELIKISENVLIDNKCDFCMFAPLTDELTRFYMKRGYTILNRSYTYEGRSRNKYILDKALIKPLNQSEKVSNFINSKAPFDIGEYDY